MADIRFYTDEHVARAVVRGLRERGIDVLSVPEAGMMGARDVQHLALALREDRVLFTQDTDFCVLPQPVFHMPELFMRVSTLPLGASFQDLCLSISFSRPKRCADV